MSAATASHARSIRPLALVLGAGALLATSTGCEWDSFIDPSVMGRWERTPTVVPILERIASIEGESDDFVEYSDVQPGDLKPELTDYRVAPGDGIALEIFDLIEAGIPSLYNRIVDTRGRVTIPQVGEIYVDGLTAEEIRTETERRIADLVADPLVSVQITSPRQTTYNIIGGNVGAGTFFIPTADFRLLEALTNTGGVNDQLDYVYVIRQSPIDGEAQLNTGGSLPAGETPPPPSTGEGVLDLLDDLADEEGASPSLLAQPDESEPEVQLTDEPESQPGASTGGWVYVDGRWERRDIAATSEQPHGTGGATEGEDDPLGRLVTQRVIRVPLDRLLAGDARYNVVIRPGDTVRIPSQFGGNAYVAGQVARPGVFGVAPQLTLMRLVDSAGGLSAIGIPERVDLTRMVGNDRQATIRLNLRAIAEGTQPDLFIKNNDRINVGTNFWALPLAVVRNGFRASYGFGFLLDRNFGNDVFGAPPTNNNN
ncbi:MAG: polysaccharide biosynthesis/export family protein [Planctomycetota bacterium]